MKTSTALKVRVHLLTFGGVLLVVGHLVAVCEKNDVVFSHRARPYLSSLVASGFSSLTNFSLFQLFQLARVAVRFCSLDIEFLCPAVERRFRDLQEPVRPRALARTTLPSCESTLQVLLFFLSFHYVSQPHTLLCPTEQNRTEQNRIE